MSTQEVPLSCNQVTNIAAIECSCHTRKLLTSGFYVLRIVIIINMEVVQMEAPIIGDPKPCPADGTPAPPPSNPSGGYGQPPSQSAKPLPPPAAGSFPAPVGAGRGPSYGGGVSGGSAPPAGSGGVGGTVPPPRYGGQGPVVKNEAAIRIVPIDALNPYMGKWTIKARVTSKGDMRRYHNARGEGKVFSFDLLDAQGGEIRVTGFNKEVDMFYDKIQVSPSTMSDLSRCTGQNVPPFMAP